VIHHPRPDRDELRVAYAIGREVGGAVTRNQVRRRLRQLVREVDQRGVLSPGDLLITTRTGAAAAGYAELRVDLEQACVELTGASR
jgi:ribonuclease P protein component